ncbi:MAG: TIGR04066 family peptide maturation system protein, partial [Oscillospiraceae bacterium]
DLNFEYEIVELITLNGSALVGKDAGYADCRNKMGIIIKGDIVRAINENDAVIISEGKLDDAIHCHSYEIMESSLKKGKEVICLADLSNEQAEYLQKTAQDSGVTFQYFSNDKFNLESYLNQSGATMYTPIAPVIFVGGLVEESNNFEVFLALCHKFKAGGYRVCGIGGTKYCEAFNLISKPTILEDRSSTNEQKINTINTMLKDLEYSEKPDIIIIQIPDAMLRFSDIITNKFGVNAFLISQAVQPSYFLCTTMCDMLESEGLKDISNCFSKRFGYPIDCLHVSTLTINPGISMDEHKLCFFHQDIEYVDKKIEELGAKSTIPVINILDDQQLDIVYENILNAL